MREGVGFVYQLGMLNSPRDLPIYFTGRIPWWLRYACLMQETFCIFIGYICNPIGFNLQHFGSGALLFRESHYEICASVSPSTKWGW